MPLSLKLSHCSKQQAVNAQHGAKAEEYPFAQGIAVYGVGGFEPRVPENLLPAKVNCWLIGLLIHGSAQGIKIAYPGWFTASLNTEK